MNKPPDPWHTRAAALLKAEWPSLAQAQELLSEALRERDELQDELSDARDRPSRGMYAEMTAQRDAALARATAAEDEQNNAWEAFWAVIDDNASVSCVPDGGSDTWSLDDIINSVGRALREQRLRAEAAEARVAELEGKVDKFDQLAINVAQQMAAAAERAAIVGWLREGAETGDRWDPLVMGNIADDIESLAHHPAPTTHAGDGDE
jgi:hypothetical protein